MKSIAIFVMSLFLAASTLSAAPVEVADGYCTFYYSKDYRGKMEKCGDGDHYPGKWGWAPRSLKLGDGCKAIFYYTDRFGKDKQYTFNGSEKDLYRKMAQWKFKSNKYWDYIKKVVIKCGGGNGHANQGNNNHNNNNNSWEDYHKKGQMVCWAKGNYGDQFYGYKYGTYRLNDLKFHFYSLRLPQGTRCIFRYENRNGQKKEHAFTGNVKDLRTYFRQWNLRNANDPWRYIKEIHFEKHQGGGMANNNGNGGNNMRWEDYHKKGQMVCWAKGNYGDQFYGYKYGTYRLNDLKFHFYSLRLPQGTRCIFRYENRNGQKKEHAFTGNVKDLRTYFRQWNLRNANDPWRYIREIHFEKHQGGGMANNNGNGGNNMRWEDYHKKGQMVCWAKGNYGDQFYGYKYGTYRLNDLKFHFYSLRLPEGTRCIFRYENRNGQKKEHAFTGNVKDLRTYFRQWNLRNANDPWRYISEIHFEKHQGGGMANNNGNGGNNMRWEDYHKKGQMVCWAKGNYGDQFYGYKYGTYRLNDLKFHFYSLRLPQGTRCIFRYENRNGQKKEHAFTGNVKDLRTYFRQWNLRNANDPWRYIREIHFEKYTGGNNNGNNNNNGNHDNQRGGPLAKGGAVVFYKYAKFEGEKYDKVQGSYDYKRLKFIPGSFVLSSSRYMVMQYQDKRGRIQSEVFKRNVRDFEYELRQLGVKDEREPLKSVRKITIMVE